eukprot:scaffold109812_cov41-Tisochrysis_lutea.AAC.3
MYPDTSCPFALKSLMKMIVVSFPLRTISSRSARAARKGNPPMSLPADANALGAARSLLSRASSMMRLQGDGGLWPQWLHGATFGVARLARQYPPLAQLTSAPQTLPV